MSNKEKLLMIAEMNYRNGQSVGSTTEIIAAAFILGDMSKLPGSYSNREEAWDRLGDWQSMTEEAAAEWRERKQDEDNDWRLAVNADAERVATYLDQLMASIFANSASGSAKLLARVILNLCDQSRDCELWRTLINLDENNNQKVFSLMSYTARFGGHYIKTLVLDEDMRKLKEIAR